MRVECNQQAKELRPQCNTRRFCARYAMAEMKMNVRRRDQPCCISKGMQFQPKGEELKTGFKENERTRNVSHSDRGVRRKPQKTKEKHQIVQYKGNVFIWCQSITCHSAMPYCDNGPAVGIPDWLQTSSAHYDCFERDQAIKENGTSETHLSGICEKQKTDR